MDDVAKVIELWTGIPAVKIQETEFAKLANLETELKKKIIGQDEGADLSGRRRPASFIFVGPTGVGKTELVKQLRGCSERCRHQGRRGAGQGGCRRCHDGPCCGRT